MTCGPDNAFHIQENDDALYLGFELPRIKPLPERYVAPLSEGAFTGVKPALLWVTLILFLGNPGIPFRYLILEFAL